MASLHDQGLTSARTAHCADLPKPAASLLAGRGKLGSFAPSRVARALGQSRLADGRNGDLAETEISDPTMMNFKAASNYAAAQGWLIVKDDVLRLNTAGLRAA